MSRRQHRRRTPAHAATSATVGPGAYWGPALCAILVAIGALTYANALSNPFVLDDRATILENAQIRELSSWAIFRAEREQTVAGRPAVNATLALNYALGGTDPTGYHAVNIALHIWCAVMLFAVARRLWRRAEDSAAPTARSAAVAFAVALIWLVHPVNSEVVNYITQRTESMMAGLYLLTIYAALRAAGDRARRRWAALAVAACALGMAAKESMVTAPLMVVVVDRIFVFDSFRLAFESRWRLYLGLASSWLLLAALLADTPRTLSAGFSTDVSVWTYLLNQAPMIVRYLWLAVWPSSLVANYGWPASVTLSDVWPYALVIITLLAATATALLRYPRIGFLGAWFFLALAPTSSILPIATEVGAERRMYLPLAAVIALLVVGTLWAWTTLSPLLSVTRRSTRTVSIASAVTLATVSTALALTTVARNREYRSDLQLRQTTVERYPTPATHHGLAVLLLEAGRRDEALPHLRAALPGDPRAHYTLGIELYKENRLDDALAEFSQFIDKQPRLQNVVAAHGYRGEIFQLKHNWPAAIAEYRAVLALEPDNTTASLLLGDALVAVEQFDDAIAQYQRYLTIDPSHVGVLNQLGLAYGLSGREHAAVTTFERATTLDPNHPKAQYNLALALWRRGDTDDALLHARRAIELQPDDPDSRTLLQAMLESEGHK